MDLWNDNRPVKEISGFDIDVPLWIEQDISPYSIAAIVQGGCDSGAYMPAVTYYIAGKTMGDHGDDVLDFISDNYGSLPNVDEQSWSGIACVYLSCAVELWAHNAHNLLEQIEEDEEEE